MIFMAISPPLLVKEEQLSVIGQKNVHTNTVVRVTDSCLINDLINKW